MLSHTRYTPEVHATCQLNDVCWKCLTRIIRLSAVSSGVLRLTTIVLLYLDGQSTTYPPVALPLSAALVVVSLLPICSLIATPGMRQRLAQSAGISERIQRLRRGIRWLP